MDFRHPSRSHQDRTRREDRRSKFYEISDNLRRLAKAPNEVEAYRTFVLDLARSVAAAAPGGDEAEADAIAKIEAALASGGAPAS